MMPILDILLGFAIRHAALVRLSVGMGGIVAIVYGVSLIHEPSAWIVAGFLIWLDLFISGLKGGK